jgi:signal transduction histidine kinase/ActR/RegA family two-component response regulator
MGRSCLRQRIRLEDGDSQQVYVSLSVLNESRHGCRQDDPSAAVLAAARTVIRLDAQFYLAGEGNSWLARIWAMASQSSLGAQQASDALLVFACVWIAAIFYKSNVRSHRSRGGVCTLGVLLAFWGAAQFTSDLMALPVYRLLATSFVAAVSCWATAVTLRPTKVRVPVAREVGDYEREIAERRRAEAALKTSEAEARKFAEADARKNEFLAMLGHELRNPLAPIRNAVKIMKQRGFDDADLCWARDVVDYQVRQMAQLVDDLLEISRVTSGKVRLQKEVVDVATIVAFAVETSRPAIESQHHRLSIVLPPEPVYLDADSIRMAQVLSNLLNNAAKYTTPKGQIRLSAACEGAEAVFRVRDNGIGIPPEMLSQIFDLFTQVDRSLAHSQGGLGLGLTLVRSLVEMHGGSVQALSDGLSRGSEFVVRLPVLAKPHGNGETAKAVTSVASEQERQSSGTSRRVLVVDDNVLAAQSLAMILKLAGHDVEITHDGHLTLEAVRRFRPEVVLLDIGLPSMDGYEVARRLRHEPELGAGINLLVAVTGYAEDEARRRSCEAGFDHHLVKPVDPDGVLALVSSLV